MGCDIHAYIEYRFKGEDNCWMNFGSRFNLRRNYNIFARLAGVRSNDSSEPLFPRRGMPEDPAFITEDDNVLYVGKESDQTDSKVIKAEVAERWVNSGISKWMDDKHSRVTHFDWHSHSWVTPDEFAKVIRGQAISADYKAFLAAMKSLEKSGMDVRMVFWFDN